MIAAVVFCAAFAVVVGPVAVSVAAFVPGHSSDQEILFTT